MKGTVWLLGVATTTARPDGKVVTQLPYSRGRYLVRTRCYAFGTTGFGQLEGAEKPDPPGRPATKAAPSATWARGAIRFGAATNNW